jgi:hypothetical protein
MALWLTPPFEEDGLKPRLVIVATVLQGALSKNR